MSQIPVIDLRSIDAGQEFHHALRDSGFAAIINHDIDRQLRAEIERLSRLFFAESDAFKMRISMANAGSAWRGFFPVGSEFTSGMRDQKEGLYFGIDHLPSSPAVIEKWPMHGQNQWPQGQKYDDFATIVTTYMRALTELGHRLMTYLAQGLGLDKAYFRQRFSDDPTLLFRIFNYPKDRNPDKLFGVGDHTDMGFLTLLTQDDCGGLEVQLPKGTWIPVPPIDDAFVINIGDMLHLWTHGIYHATRHRVRNSSNRDRISFPLFFDPNWQANLMPIERKLLSDSDLAQVRNNQSRWDGIPLDQLTPHMTYGDFVWKKIKGVFPQLARSLH